MAKYVLSVVSDGTAPAKVTVSTSKPHALSNAASAEVVIHREPSDYHDQKPDTIPSQVEYPLSTISTAIVGSTHTAVLALGSNLGDRFHNIEYALRLLEIPGEILQEVHPSEEDASLMTLKVVDTSFLYETEPMYVTDQPKFINGACAVSNGSLTY